jgi:hypothetical protein
LTAPAQAKPTGLFVRKLYGTPGAHVRHLRANGNDELASVQGFRVLVQQDAVHVHVLNDVGQSTQGGLVGAQAPIGMHVYCQFVEYTDTTFQIIAAVSNVTDTLVVP